MRGYRALQRTDGTPFFWLGDTCWAAAFRVTWGEWQEYVQARAEQGFTVIQLSSLPLLSDFPADAIQRRPFRLRSDTDWDFDLPDAEYFDLLGRMIAHANGRGLVVALVILWWTYVPQARLWSMPMPRPVMSLGQAKRYVRSLIELVGDGDVIWLVTGDDTYHEQDTLRFTRELGQYVKDSDPLGRLVTVHPSRLTGPFFSGCPWLDVHMIQSSHFYAYQNLAIEYARQEWRRKPHKPIVNGEICYEQHAGFDYGHVFDRLDVRRASWWSVLEGCLCGVTYGASGVWNWARPGELDPSIRSAGSISWREALRLPGASDLVWMRRALEKLHWWRLIPSAQRLLGEPARHVAIASSRDGSLLLAYIPLMPPTCAEIQIDTRGLNRAARVRLVDPATGSVADLGPMISPRMRIVAPDARDSVLIIE
jgi:hypothetical protein